VATLEEGEDSATVAYDSSTCLGACEGGTSEAEHEGAFETGGGDGTFYEDASRCQGACEGGTPEAERAGAFETGGGDGALSEDGSTCQGACDAAISMAIEIALFALSDCAHAAECSPTIQAMNFGNVAECVRQSTLNFSWLVSLPGSGFSAEQVHECADALAALSCGDYLSPVANLVGACSPAGTRSVGQGCTDSSQCASGFCPASGFACSKCAPVPSEGAPCAGDSDCAAGMACSTAGACTQVALAGEACGARPCDSYHVCSGTCQALPETVGAVCGSNVGVPDCDESAGVTCDSATSGTCVPIVVLDAGQSCGLSTTAWRTCSTSGACISGTCHAASAASQACDSTLGPYCEWPNQCVNELCVAPPPASACP
jgi:hypothetical protein